MEALGKMSIEETYKGMWSSDATLLKSLLDAGETIIAVSGMGYGRAFFYDCDYVFQVGDDLHYIEKRMDELLFLIPPRPLVLEPKPLEWRENKDGTAQLATQDLLVFEAEIDGSWGVFYNHASPGWKPYLTSVHKPENGTFDTAKTAINEWRVNHLKSMLP